MWLIISSFLHLAMIKYFSRKLQSLHFKRMYLLLLATLLGSDFFHAGLMAFFSPSLSFTHIFFICSLVCFMFACLSFCLLLLLSCVNRTPMQKSELLLLDHCIQIKVEWRKVMITLTIKVFSYVFYIHMDIWFWDLKMQRNN